MTDRGRVPFALVGVLLLVGSGTVAVSEQHPGVGEPAVAAAMDGLAAETQTAIRSAVREAARNSAREPVLVRANSTAGSQLGANRPFRDALRLRIYLRTREYLARLDDRSRGLALSAGLPPIDGEGDVRRAIERVHVSRAGPAETWLRVGLEGVTLRARAGGRIVGRATRSPSIVVRTPVLLVHRRVGRFEDLLNADLTRPGLSRRLSAVLYPLVWARGYAQFSGRAIENVLANRHIALATNGNVLALQRRVFGRAEPAGRRVYERTVRDAAVKALLRASNSSVLRRLQRLRDVTERVSGEDPLDRLTPGAGEPGPGTPMTVDIDRTADLAYRRSIANVNDTLDRTYAPKVRVRADVDRLNRRSTGGGRPTAARARIDSATVTRTAVDNRSGSPPEPAPGWHRLFGYSRTVTVTDRTVTTWTLSGNETARTTRTVRRTYAVDLVVAGNHTVGPAPSGRIQRVHERGGPFQGPNLADLRARVSDHLATRGGVDTLAVRAARGSLDTGADRVQAARPAALAGWARPDLTTLRHRIRNLSVTVERGRVATLAANPPARLAHLLRDRREALVDAPETYENVAARARVGVRADYLDRVIDRLDAAAERHRSGRGNLDTLLPGVSTSSGDLLADAMAAEVSMDRSGPTPVRMSVDAAPAYLTLEAVDHAAVPRIRPDRIEHPLVARNLNAVSVPTSGAIETLFGVLDRSAQSSTRTAAQVLAVARSAGLGAEALSTDGALRDDIAKASRWLERSLVRVLARHDLGSAATRNRTVAAALARWETPAARARALANGSAAHAVSVVATERWPERLNSTLASELLAIDLEAAAVSANSIDAVRPSDAVVRRAVTSVRQALGATGQTVMDQVESASVEHAAAVAARLPAGLPVLPTPGFWYAMVNAWHVQVRGSYAHFVVSVPRGAPDRLPADLRYVRETRPVRLDVDGDGTAELLGRNRRLTLEAETVVAVAVPPKPRGVGDVDERDERSPGWPAPGPAADGTAK